MSPYFQFSLVKPSRLSKHQVQMLPASTDQALRLRSLGKIWAAQLKEGVSDTSGRIDTDPGEQTNRRARVGAL